MDSESPLREQGAFLGKNKPKIEPESCIPSKKQSKN